MKRPSFQFYPGDWLRDTALRSCSIGARGLWIDMLCLMHDGEPYGHLKVGSKVIHTVNLARILGATLLEVEGWLQELQDARVYEKDGEGAIFSRRMVRDEKTRVKRAAGGCLGGNPVLNKQHATHPKVNLGDNLGDNVKPTLGITPSSSSSSSSSLSEREIVGPPNLTRNRKPNSVEEVIVKGQMVGVSEPDCRDWFRDCEACDWKRGDGTPFDNWPKQLTIHRDKNLKNGKPHTNGHATDSKPTPWNIQQAIKGRVDRITKLRFEHADEEGGSFRWPKEKAAERNECAKLAREVEELEKKLSEVKV